MRRVAAAAALALALLPGAPIRPSAARPLRACPPGPPPEHVRPVTRPRWLDDTVITVYWPAPESWFDGKLVSAPGLAGRHRVDWLYGARGLPMQGEGIGRDGRFYHYAGPYDISWVNLAGETTTPCW